VGEPLLHSGERFSTALCGTHPQPWRGGEISRSP
jgi:hypothetical protein